MPTETTVLLRSIRRWLLVNTVLLGIGVITLAHTGYVLTVTSTTYLQSLVFSIAGVLGGISALVAGLSVARRHPTVDADRRSTE